MKIMINGLPGNVAKEMRNYAEKHNFNIVPFSLTGSDINEKKINGITLIKPEMRESAIKEIKKEHFPFISIDYTHPTSVNSNAEFYAKYELPFVMGTTGGDREKLIDDIKNSNIQAVIAPNMAKQIVGFQAMMEFASKNFPMLFSNYTIKIEESHQKTKADTSGTAKAMVKYFQKLGLNCQNKDIIKIRDEKKQTESLGIPQKHIKGHAWHTYTIISNDRNIKFEFKHNINGRSIYCEGTFDAVKYLAKKVANGEKGKVYTMIDILSSKA